MIEPILESFPEPAFLLDAHDRVLKTNRHGRALLGDSDDAFSLAARLGSSELILFLARRRNGNETSDTATEITLRRSPRPDMVFECSASRFPAASEKTGTGRFLFLVLRNVSRLRRLENLRREFVSDISHDLRTPVTVLKGYADTLSEDYDSLDDSARRRFVERLCRNANRLHRMLEDMLLLATLENGESALNRRHGVLNGVLREAVDIFSERFAGVGAKIILESDADAGALSIDPEKFLRVLQNLLENALRHAKGMTCIRISTTNNPDNSVSISVADDGAGIAQADAEKIFERFFRADKSRTGSIGTGLGLSIARRLILLHGGTVEAFSNRPHGLVVKITLPA